MIYLKKEIKYHITLGTSVNLYHGSETISYLGPKIWNLVSKNTKDSISFSLSIVSVWKQRLYFGTWPYKSCKVYLPQIGFIWLEVWSKSRFNVGGFERVDCFMFFVKVTDKQNFKYIFKWNVNWFFCFRFAEFGAKFRQRYGHIFFSVSKFRSYIFIDCSEERFSGTTFHIEINHLHWKLVYWALCEEIFTKRFFRTVFLIDF